jgi:3-hydroxybutyryl-CoA dehydrogenase
MDVKTVAMIGSGVMGTGIAQVLAMGGYDVHLHDVRPEALTNALERIEHGKYGLRRGIALGKVTEAQMVAALEHIATFTDLAAACAGVDLVIEAVPEDLGLKVRVFRQLDQLAPPHAILASNTSGFPIAGLAASTDRPAHVIGWHFASPVPVMRLAEITVHTETSDEARDAVVAVAARCGKDPQVIKDDTRHWGFVANRIMGVVIREARQIVAEGIATPEQVDALLKGCFRWPVGPFEMTGGRTRQGWE